MFGSISTDAHFDADSLWGLLFRALDLNCAADKVLKIPSKLIEDETKREHASNCIVGQVSCQAIPAHVGDGSLIASNGFDDRIQARGRLPGGKGLTDMLQEAGGGSRHV